MARKSSKPSIADYQTKLNKMRLKPVKPVTLRKPRRMTLTLTDLYSDKVMRLQVTVRPTKAGLTTRLGNQSLPVRLSPYGYCYLDWSRIKPHTEKPLTLRLVEYSTKAG